MLSFLKRYADLIVLGVLFALIILGVGIDGRREAERDAIWRATLSPNDTRRVSTFDSGIKTLPAGGFIEMRRGLLMKVVRPYTEGAEAFTPLVMFCPTAKLEVLDLSTRNLERVANIYGAKHSDIPRLEAACTDEYVARRVLP